MSSSYFSTIYALFERKKQEFMLKSKDQDDKRPKSTLTSRSSASSTTVVKCGYDELYYDNDDQQDDSEGLNEISSDDTEATYCIVDNARSLPFKKLALMHGLPESFSGNDLDIISEFSFLLTQIKQTCHHLDSCRCAVQFAETDAAIGQKLKDIILFIHNRYYGDKNVGDSGIAFLALLLLGIQVLKTVPEVKEQLLHRTHIGRCIVRNMLIVLQTPKNVLYTPRTLYYEIEFMQILFDCSQLKTPQEMPDMIDILMEMSTKFAKVDKEWNHFENYASILTLSRDLFSY